MKKPVALIGYSGHSYVACYILKSDGRKVIAYCDKEEKTNNPFDLKYLGSEHNRSTLKKLAGYDVFVSVGENFVRKKNYEYLYSKNVSCINAVHSSAILSQDVTIGKGVMIAPGVIVNPLCVIGNGAICNTGSVIEHECMIGDFAHIAPGAVLCGNVKIGECSFIGANSVVKQGITIGKNVTIGAGSVVIKSIPDNSKAWGNPAKTKK